MGLTTTAHGRPGNPDGDPPAVLTRRMLIAGAGALALVGPRVAQAAPSHDAFTELLQRYVVVSRSGLNRVRYAAFKAGGRAPLDRYVAGLSATRVSSLGARDAFAYWVNLYNAVTLQVVLEHYPVASIRDIDLGGGLFSRGPWKKDLVTVEGRKLSLDDIEHGILRKRYKDARVHYAVNCASVGCPDLAPRAYSGATLEAMLEDGARGYINTPRGVRVEAAGIRASRIYNWFAEDFGSETQLRAHWRRYARPDLAAAIEGARRIAGYDYDWSLNDAG